jgi:hypothetical protein
MSKKEQEAWVAKRLREAGDLYNERHKVYGDNYKQFGSIMMALFPNGIELTTCADWNRLGILVQCISKASRYTNNFHKGGHDDSLADLTVYATMLRELDKEGE